ncbi:MAG TPA: acyloxyacyl hydrolase [Burkholderiales bacterium]|nr:acyloxyacyl hydrolase [Burkholderiales bacterium]
MIRKIALALGAATLIVASPAAFALDGASVELGRGNERTNLLRISFVDKWRKKQPPAGDEWRLAGYWDLSLAVWDNREESTADLGFTPVFRIERRSLYLEAALGFHLVQAHISADRALSSAFQFAEHLGVGFISGNYTLGVHVQHVSNGGITEPNPGINFVLVRLQYHLD